MSSIQSAQSSVLRFVKQWLNLPCNCTPGTVFHPDVLNLPFLPNLKESAKLSYILAIERSVDPIIVNCGILSCVMSFRMHQMLFLMLFLLLNL